jgi:hypothetical protein
MWVPVIINQNVFTVTHDFFTVTNIPFRHGLKNVFCILYLQLYNKNMLVFTVTIIIWNYVSKDCYGRDNSAFRYWLRVLQKIFLMGNYVHCYREQRFISTWGQNVFTVTHDFFTVTNIPFRHGLKNVFCILYLQLYNKCNLKWRCIVANLNCSVDIRGINFICFLISTEYWKGLCVIIAKLISGMYIVLLYSLTSVQWSKITELDYRFATIQRHLRLHLDVIFNFVNFGLCGYLLL